MSTRRFLNRSCKFYVMTDAGDPEGDPVVAPTYSEMAFNSLQISDDVQEANLTTTNDAGRKYTVPAERGTTITVEGKAEYDATDGTSDAAQTELRSLNALVDVEAVGSFRIDILGKVRKAFQGWVKVEELGGDQNDGAPFRAEVHVVGAIETSTISA